MKLFLFILDLPISLAGMIPMLLSIPHSVRLIKNPIALVFKVRSFWWAFGYLKHARAMTIGHIILLSSKELENDFEHEIIHVKQHERNPIIFPLLYLYELLKNGYRKNRFEDEAYTLSHSVYKGSKQ